MDTTEHDIVFLRGANKFWGIPIISLSEHLNGNTRSRKIGPSNVLIEEEDEAIVAWVLSMQECGLSITLQQLKWKVPKVTQTQPTSFQNGVFGDF
jgi:hypothetical protein